jgi:hypothetical protein
MAQALCLDDALTYRLDYGWSVFPVGPDKKPLVEWKPYQKEPAGEKTIRGWYSQHPDAGVAVATGALSNLLVVDADSAEGLGTITQLGIPRTPTASTGGGPDRRHWYFKLPSGGHDRNTAGRVAGLDTRAEGGYVVAPHSRHFKGGHYDWVVSPAEIAPMDVPASLLVLFTAPPSGHEGAEESVEVGDIATLLAEGSPVGRRNHDAARLAGHFLARGLPPAEVEVILLGWADRCTPPFSRMELRAVIGSIAQAEARKQGTHNSAPWAMRASLPPAVPGAPALPPRLLPEPLRPWLTNVATRASLPLEYVAVPALTGASTVIGRGVGVCPERFNDWLGVPNLWGGIVGRPGWMKSTAVAEGLKPLTSLAARARARAKDEHDKSEARRTRLAAELDGLRQAMAAAGKKQDNHELDRLQADWEATRTSLEALAVPERRYLTQDATVEKLGELLQENPNGLLVLRDELAGWLRTLDKAGREGDREFYLEAWNGTGGYTFDRIGRGTIHIDAVCLCVCGGIQPGKLQAIIDGAIAGGEEADGSSSASNSSYGRTGWESSSKFTVGRTGVLVTPPPPSMRGWTRSMSRGGTRTSWIRVGTFPRCASTPTPRPALMSGALSWRRDSAPKSCALTRPSRGT